MDQINVLDESISFYTQKDEAYINLLKQNLIYGTDYYDLVKFYNEMKEYDNALKTALEGIEKGEGRIIDLLDYLIEFYNQRDYKKSLKFMIMAFKKDPSLKRYKAIRKYCTKEEWKEISDELYDSARNSIHIKADIDYYNKDYYLVLEYVKNSHYDYKDWCSKLDKHYPDDIIEIYDKRAKTIIDKKIACKYSNAVHYIKKIKEVYLQILKQPDKWERYLSQLKNTYSNLPALQALLAEIQ